MARIWTLALVASLLAGGVAAAQEDPIGDLLGGPSLSPAEAPPAPAPAGPAATPPAEAAPAPEVPTAPQPELDEEGNVIPPPAPSASTPTPPPPAAAAPESQPPPPAQAAAPPAVAPEAPQPPPTAVAPVPATQAVAPPPAPPAAQAAVPPPPQASAPPPPAAPPAQVPAQESYAAPAPSQTAPPVANLPTGPIPYQALTPSPAATTAAPAAPYARPATPYPQPSPPYATAPAPPPPYSSPPMGLASAPPPSTGVQTGARSPVHIDEHGRTPDAAPTYRELDYEQRLRSSYASAQGLQGPLDGGWTLSVDGDERYFLQLVERSSGLLEGVWRDLRRTGALNASGFVEGIQRYGGQLTFSFRPDGRDELVTATLTAGADGKWSGEMVRGRDRKSITLRRN
jgi:hypothetical protein